MIAIPWLLFLACIAGAQDAAVDCSEDSTEAACPDIDRTVLLQNQVRLAVESSEGRRDIHPREYAPTLFQTSNGVELMDLSGHGHDGTISETSAALIGISAIDLGLALGACAVLFTIWRTPRSPTATAGFLGLTKATQAAIMMLFIFLSASQMFVQPRVGGSGYSTMSSTILIYVGKTSVSLLMFLSKGNLQEGFSTLRAPGCARFGRVPGFMLPMIPAALLAGVDVLAFLSLTNLDPVTYQILMRLRIIMVCFVWQLVFNRKLSQTQWLALLLFAVAGITKGMDRAQVMDPRLHAGVVFLVIQISLGSLSLVSTELCLKEMAMPTDLVNTCTYFYGLLWIVAALLFQHGPAGLYSVLFSPAAWAQLYADPWMIGAICILITLGIATAYMLRELSNIVKELCGGIVLLISTVLELAAGDSSVTSKMSLSSISLTILGIVVYNANPLQNKAAKELNEHTNSAREVEASATEKQKIIEE